MYLKIVCKKLGHKTEVSKKKSILVSSVSLFREKRSPESFLNKKTPKGVYAGCVGVRKNYRYVEWQWKVE